MSVPVWAQIGVVCVCTDDDWQDVLETGTTGAFPVKGERYVIAGAYEVGANGFLILNDLHLSPDLYAASAFRPLTQLERDVDLFAFALKGAAASLRPELVPAS